MKSRIGSQVVHLLFDTPPPPPIDSNEQKREICKYTMPLALTFSRGVPFPQNLEHDEVSCIIMTPPPPPLLRMFLVLLTADLEEVPK